MPDYNLGRATGEIVVGYDGRGIREAEADMAGVAAEAASLDAAMGRVNKSFDENREKTTASSESIVRARGELAQLEKSYKTYQEEVGRATNRQKEAAAEANHVVEAYRNQEAGFEELRKANNDLSKATDEVSRVTKIAANAHEEYQAKVRAVRQEVDLFNKAHQDATSGFRSMAKEAEAAGKAIEGLNQKLSSVAKILGQAGIFGLFGGAAGGSLFATGAGGLQLLSTAMSAVIEVGRSFVGAIALIPAGVNAAAISLGTLALGFHGISAALSSMEDPAKFTQAIRDLSPAAQSAMLTIQSFTEAFRGARNEIQQSLFAPIIADIQPLIRTWLPELMNAGKAIASQFGQAFHQVFQYFQTPAALQAFKGFTDNMVKGFAAARGAIQPLLSAWNTLAGVGSSVFPRLGAAVAKVAEEFNNFIQKTSNNGTLLEFINRALPDFTAMGHIIRDVALGINNMFGIFNAQNGNALDGIAKLAAEFRAWTSDVTGGGTQAIGGFFSLIKTAAEAVKPQLQLIGQALAVVGRTLTTLGVGIQPGLGSFFTSLLASLQTLAPYVVQMGPAINSFLSAFGSTLQQVVTSIGPQLPGFFANMSAAFVDLMKVIPPVVGAFSAFMSHVTPKEIELFLGLVVAIKALSATISILKPAMAALDFVLDANPIGLLVLAVAALSAAAIVLVENWDKVKSTLENAWSSITGALGGLWASISNWFDNIDWGSLGAKIAHGIANGIRGAVNDVGDAASSVAQKVWNFIYTNSPAKEGPLSQMSPDEIGARFVSQYAEGMGSSTGAVSSAASGVAGAAAGSGGSGGGGSFSSSGVTTASGGNVTKGNSGFDHYVDFITKDLTAWNNIFKEAFGLVQGISTVITNTVKVAANLWNKGDNPLTRPGGIAGPPLPIAQQEVPGVPQKPIPGVAPDAYGKALAAGAPPEQENVPGVPNKPLGVKGKDGTTYYPTAGGKPVDGSAPPAPGTPAAATADLGLGAPSATTTAAAAPAAPGDSPLVTALKAKGIGPKQIRMIQGFSDVEGKNPSGNPTLGFTDDQLGSGALQPHVDALVKQMKDREAVAGGPFPENGSDSDQASWIAKVVGQDGSASDWQGNAQPKDYVQRVQKAMQGFGVQATTTGAATPAPPVGNINDQTARALGPNPPSSAGSGISPAGAAGGLVGIAGLALARVASKRRAKAKMAAGESLDADEAALAMEPEAVDAAKPAAEAPKSGVDTAGLAKKLGVSEDIVKGWSPADVEWLNGINSRPVNEGAALGNLSESEMSRVGNMLTGKDPGAIPSAPKMIADANGVMKPFDEVMAPKTVPNGIPGQNIIRGAAPSPADINTTGPITPGEKFMSTPPQGAAPAESASAADPIAADAGASTASRLLGVAGRAITPIAMLPWAYDQAEKIARQSQAQDDRAAGKKPTLDASDFGGIASDDSSTPYIPGGGGPGAEAARRRGSPVGATGSGGQLNAANLPEGMGAAQGLHPNAELLNRAITYVFGERIKAAGGSIGGNRSNDSGSGEHQGGALDIITGPLGTAAAGANLQLGNEINQFILQNKDAFGAQWNIWQGRFINAQTGKDRAYGDHGGVTDNHFDHVHAFTGDPNVENTPDSQGTGLFNLPSGFTPTPQQPETVAGAQPAGVQQGTDPNLLGGPNGPTRRPRSTPATTTGAAKSQDSSWMNVPDGGDLSKPIPDDVLTAHGITPDPSNPMYYNAQPGTVQNVPVPPDFKDTHPNAVVSPGGTTSLPTATGTPTAGFPQTKDQRTPLAKTTDAIAGASSIAGDAFTVFQDVIESISAAKNITDTMVRGFANTEDVVGFIQQFQTFIKTASDVAKTVGDAGGLAGGASGGADMGIGGAIQAISGIVQGALDATNAAITLGIDVYHEVGKYAGFIFGGNLGGDNTGPLGGNVRMLLNTRTNQLQTYSEDNPLNKNTFDVPSWQQSYDQQPAQSTIPPQVNIYTGPGQTPAGMMQESMWMVSTGSAPVASVSGHN